MKLMKPLRVSRTSVSKMLSLKTLSHYDEDYQDTNTRLSLCAQCTRLPQRLQIFQRVVVSYMPVLMGTAFVLIGGYFCLESLRPRSMARPHGQEQRAPHCLLSSQSSPPSSLSLDCWVDPQLLPRKSLRPAVLQGDGLMKQTSRRSVKVSLAVQVTPRACHADAALNTPPAFRRV